MAVIINGMKCHFNFKLLPKDFSAITLFGHIFFRLSKEKVMADYNVDLILNHERIHTIQAESFKTKYFAFYILYLWYWVTGLFKYGFKNNASYYRIPFEVEAYCNEIDMDYDETDWKSYRS